MFELAVMFRATQLFAHHAHLLCARSIFFQDHAFFAEVYSDAEEKFDKIIERMIALGLEDEVKLDKILNEISESLKDAPSVGAKENKEYYSYLMSQVETATQKIEELAKEEISQGALNLIAGFADDLEVLKYKISRRLKT